MSTLYAKERDTKRAKRKKEKRKRKVVGIKIMF
jgi:hypothetical protein